MKQLTLLFAVSALVAVNGQFSCPADIGTSTACYSRADRCYCVVNVMKTYDAAYMFCRSKGMDLVAIESSEEQDYLVQLISPFGRSFWWTSGSDSGHEGHWVWLSTGENFTYTNWHGGNMNGAGYDIMQLSKGLDYKWIDATSHDYFRDSSICEA